MFVDGRFEFHGCKNLPRIFRFWFQKSFFCEKYCARCDFLLFRLVGCGLVLLLGMYVTQKRLRYLIRVLVFLVNLNPINDSYIPLLRRVDRKKSPPRGGFMFTMFPR